MLQFVGEEYSTDRRDLVAVWSFESGIGVVLLAVYIVVVIVGDFDDEWWHCPNDFRCGLEG